MKACAFIFMSLLTSACGQDTVGRRHSQFDCGFPEVDVGITQTQGRVIVGLNLAPLIEQQLPKGIVVEDGCWSIAAGGALQGDFMPSDPKAEKETIYVFEYKTNNWILVDTQTYGVVNNPYGIGDRVH
jgi:hypothetical protein